MRIPAWKKITSVGLIGAAGSLIAVAIRDILENPVIANNVMWMTLVIGIILLVIGSWMIKGFR